MLTTPARPNQRPVIPELDTKSPGTDLTSAIAYAGLHTPPQSAHESRRPSLHSCWSDAPYSAGGPGFAGSLPTTPIHRIQSSNENFVHGCGNLAIDQALAASSLTPHGFPSQMVHELPTYTSAEQSSVADAFDLQFHTDYTPVEAWTRPVQPTSPFAAQPVCLGAELFPMTQNLSPECIFPGPTFPNSESPLHAFNSNFDIATFRSAQSQQVQPRSAYHQPQVIVPSQLAPHDTYDHARFEGYPIIDQYSTTLPNEYEPTVAAFDSFEAMDPPSPMEAYIEHSEDGYDMIKSEDMNLDVKSQRSTRVRSSPSISRRRSSKRSRSQKSPWHTQFVGGIEIQCEGKQFRIDKPVKHQAGNHMKTHVCTTLLQGRPCGKGFDRSEHLNRHAKSHTDEKPFPCPIKGCKTGKVQRSDNACDHYKTHLRPDKKGKRNCHVEWPELQPAIFESYEDKKKANNILQNLQLWIDQGMLDSTARGRRG